MLQLCAIWPHAIKTRSYPKDREIYEIQAIANLINVAQANRRILTFT